MQRPNFGVQKARSPETLAQSPVTGTFSFYRDNGSILKPSTCMQVPTDFRIIPNPSEFQAVEKCNVDTRSAEAKPLYKIDKLQSIFGGHSNLTCSILESCSVSQYRKGQGCLRHVVTKFWSLNRRQGGGKYTHRAHFLELFESFWFYRDRRLQKPNLQKIRTIKNCKVLVFCEGLPRGI